MRVAAAMVRGGRVGILVSHPVIAPIVLLLGVLLDPPSACAESADAASHLRIVSVATIVAHASERRLCRRVAILMCVVW